METMARIRCRRTRFRRAESPCLFERARMSSDDVPGADEVLDPCLASRSLVREIGGGVRACRTWPGAATEKGSRTMTESKLGATRAFLRWLQSLPLSSRLSLSCSVGRCCTQEQCIWVVELHDIDQDFGIIGKLFIQTLVSAWPRASGQWKDRLD